MSSLSKVRLGGRSSRDWRAAQPWQTFYHTIPSCMRGWLPEQTEPLLLPHRPQSARLREKEIRANGWTSKRQVPAKLKPSVDSVLRPKRWRQASMESYNSWTVIVQEVSDNRTMPDAQEVSNKAAEDTVPIPPSARSCWRSARALPGGQKRHCSSLPLPMLLPYEPSLPKLLDFLARPETQPLPPPLPHSDSACSTCAQFFAGEASWDLYYGHEAARPAFVATCSGSICATNAAVPRCGSSAQQLRRRTLVRH